MRPCLLGWIRHLATARDQRRREIASALLLAACRSFRVASLSHAALRVGSESASGAHRLYERRGFRPLHRIIQHQVGALNRAPTSLLPDRESR